MSGLQQVLPESFDAILEAVKETPRGRWFLENMESRLKKADTTRILEAINKLEAHVQSSSGITADSTLVARARAAIANARREIFATAEPSTGLSPEGQMFAKLASLSKEAFAAQPGLGQGVHRALSLVAELDNEFATDKGIIPKQDNSPDLFKQDEAVFEPAPQVKAATPVKPVPAPENPSRGAKLVIKRVAATQDLTVMEASADLAPVQVQPVDQQNERPEPPVFQPSTAKVEHTDIPQSRIVIIRRKAEEMEDVPLLGRDGEEPASAA